tara:strand:- start:1999 stop:3855 length:1857 start_codon:yes stop_codon:yes gene_type:complete
MPLTKISFAPGIDKQDTEYGAAGRWTDSDFVRFRYGLPEKIGGWIYLINDTLIGVARDMHAWTSLDGVRYTAIGTDRKLYVYTEGLAYDVTPVRRTSGTLTNPFATVNNSATVTVTDNGHGATVGDFVKFSNGSTTNVVNNLEMNAEFEVTTVVNNNSYTVTYKNSSGTLTLASATGSVGGNVTAVYQIAVGTAVSQYGYGWGTYQWGKEAWGTPRSSSNVTIEGRNWSFDNFGEDLLATVNNGKTFRWDTSAGTGTAAAVVTSAPSVSRFNLVSMPDRHTFLFGTETLIGSGTSQDDLFLRFSSQESFTDWVPSAANSAGSFRIQDGSKIVTAVRSRNSVLVWTDTSLNALQYVGAPFTFNLTQIGANCGAVSLHCAVDVNGTAFWMSQNSFYKFDGAISKMPCSVQDYVFEDFSITNQPETFAAVNSEFNEVTWFYTSNNAVQIDRFVTYNYLENCWSTGSLARTTWQDYGVYSKPYATDYVTSATGTTPAALGVTPGASSLFQQETGTDDNVNGIFAFIESGDFDIADGQPFLHIGRGIPNFKNLTGSVDMKLTFKSYPSSTTSATSLQTILPTTEKFDLRGRGRQANIRVESDQAGDNWRYGTLRLDVQPDGGR